MGRRKNRQKVAEDKEDALLTDSERALLDEVLGGLNGQTRDQLLPALVQLQQRQGWLSEPSLVYIGKHLGVPYSEVYGVASFYSMLSLEPQGEHSVWVCDDVSCYLNGADRVCAQVAELLGVQAGETTEDGRYSYKTVPCMGVCEKAPVLFIDRELCAGVSVEDVRRLLRGLEHERTASAD